MTNVTYKLTNKEYTIQIEGHCGYAEFGKDIVCSAVSVLIETLILYTDCCAYVDSGSVWVNGSKHMDCAEMTIAGLKAVAEAYPEFVKVTEGCPIK